MKQKLRFLMTTLLCAVFSMAWGESATSSLIFTKACGGSGTANDGAEWTITSDGSESTFDNNSGIHYGTNSKAVTYVKLETSGINGTITRVVVNTRDAQACAQVRVVVGNTTFTCNGNAYATATNTSTDYTFQGSGSGKIQVFVDRGESKTKAIYVKSVVVTYQTSSVQQPTFTPREGTYTEAQTVSISAEQGATIYYTTDGTTPSESNGTQFTSTSTITVNETTTIKAIAIKDGNSSDVASATYTILTPITIAAARAQGTGNVYTQGIVTSCVGTTAYIQDADAAICVYGQSLTVGTKYKVKGTLTTYNGLLEITSPDCTEVSSGNTVTPEEMTIEAINTNNKQGWLVKIENATVSTISDKNVTITQGENSILVRFNNNADITFATNDIITLTGNISCYNTTIQIANPTDITVAVDETPLVALDPNTPNPIIVPYTGATDERVYITYNNIADVGIVFYDADQTITERPSWFIYEGEGFDTHGNVLYSIANNDGEERTVYLKVWGTKEPNAQESERIYTDLITITQEAYVAPKDYVLFSGDLEEGDYVIYYNGKAMKNTVTNNRLGYEAVTPENNVITTNDKTIVWHIAKSGDYWTIKSLDNDKYAASTGSKNQAQVMDDGTDDKALWTVTSSETYEFVNKKNTSNSVNANLRNNGTSGFACYASSTGGALSLYKYEKVKKPVISPNGAEFTSSQQVTITASDGCTIYYTTDGSDPTTESTVYNEAFTLNATTTVKAIAAKDGETSNVVTAEFTKVSPILAIDPYTTEVEAAGAEGTLNITYQHFNIEDVNRPYIAYYKPNTNDYLNPKPDWITLTVNVNDGTISYTVNENTTEEERVAWFKLIYYFNDGITPDRVFSDMVKFTQPAPPKPTSNRYVKVTSTSDLSNDTYLIVYEDGELAFDGSLETLDASGNNIPVTFDGGLIIGTTIVDAATFTITTTTDGSTIKGSSGKYIGQTSNGNGMATNENAIINTISFDSEGNADIVSSNAHLRYNNASNQSRFRYYKSDSYTNQKAVQLYKLVEPFTFTIQEAATDGTDHYATISALGYDYFKVTSDVEVYAVDVDNNKLVLSEACSDNGIIKDGAYLVRGAAGTYTFTAVNPTQDEIAAIPNNVNLLVSTGDGSSTGEYSLTAEDMAAAHYDGTKFYKLSLYNGKVGFFWGANGGAAFNYKKAHQAYLAVEPAGSVTDPSGDSSSQNISGFFFDGTTAINEVLSETAADGTTYSISGVRMDGKQLPKGIYIVNGKKVVIK